jgi:hypothetical protein
VKRGKGKGHRDDRRKKKGKLFLVDFDFYKGLGFLGE